jgi:YbbR domain-containing protein
MSKTNTIKKNFKSNLFTFLGCLIVAAFMWLFQSLNRNYSTTIKFPVKYLNLPKDKFIYSPLPKVCEAEVKASGMKLLLSYFKPIDEVLVIDYQTQKKVFGSNGSTEKLIISPQMLSFAFNTKLEILKLKPDTIFIEYKKLYSKMVPIKHNIKTKFKDNFNIVGSIQIKPSHILITGDTASINHIDFIETEDLLIQNLEAGFSEPIKLKERTDQWHSNYSVNEVTASAEVDRFTEKELELEVQAKNIPNGYDVNILPKKIKIKFSVAYKDFDFIKADFFKVSVDFKNQMNTTVETLLDLENKPGNIYNVRLLPEKVKFLFKKKQ